MVLINSTYSLLANQATWPSQHQWDKEVYTFHSERQGVEMQTVRPSASAFL